MKYNDLLNCWYSEHVKPLLKKKTCDRYFEIMEMHLKPELGKKETKDLTVAVLQRYVSNLTRYGNLRTGNGLSASSINGIITVIKSSLRFAYESGEIKAYTADKIVRPKSQGRKITCFTEIEQAVIEKEVLYCGKRSYIGVAVCLYSGLRIGELLALTWGDVDLESGVIYVNKTCHYGKDENGVYRRFTDKPKTVSSRREIPIPKRLVSILKKHKKSTRTEFVIENKNGEPMSVRAYQKAFYTLLKKLNIRMKGFHSLRHTFATRAIECGMDVKTLSEILGHNDATITLNRYAHSLIKHKRDMMNKLGKRLL